MPWAGWGATPPVNPVGPDFSAGATSFSLGSATPASPVRPPWRASRTVTRTQSSYEYYVGTQYQSDRVISNEWRRIFPASGLIIFAFSVTTYYSGMGSFHCQVIYKLTPWNGNLLEKLIVTQIVNVFSTFYGTWRFITVFTRACCCLDRSK